MFPKFSTVICLDPLEQFDILPVYTPVIAEFALTNATLFLALNALIIGVALAEYRFQFTNYDHAITALYNLVRAIVRENMYLKKQRYFNILFYLFMTILASNMIGLLPYSFTVTSSFVVTLFLSLGHFLGLNAIATSRHEWLTFNLFLPAGAPLALAPLLIFIEAVSYIARIFSLSIRLFANMMSGHALLKILIGFAWSMLVSASALVLFAIIPWSIVTAIMFLELLIAFLQAYVFTILTALYINDVLNFHD